MTGSNTNLTDFFPDVNVTDVEKDLLIPPEHMGPLLMFVGVRAVNYFTKMLCFRLLCLFLSFFVFIVAWSFVTSNKFEYIFGISRSATFFFVEKNLSKISGLWFCPSGALFYSLVVLESKQIEHQVKLKNCWSFKMAEIPKLGAENGESSLCNEL